MVKIKLSLLGIVITATILSIMIGIPETTNIFAQNNTDQSSIGTNQTNKELQQSQPEEQFRANLSGQTVVPIVENTDAIGEVEFNINPQMDTIDYSVTVNGINQALSATMNLGTPGVNGPIIVYLYRADSPSGLIDGLLAKETIIANELDGPMKGKTIGDLANAINNGSIYVTVNTAPYPNGEIRGQILPAFES